MHPQSGTRVELDDSLADIDDSRWLVRDDTFAGNLALFRPSNVEVRAGGGVALNVKSEPLGVRSYSAASISSRDRYLFGRFEAVIQASNVSGVVTGFFLHRDSPRQEIDIEIVGSRPDRLLVNVFYNPGDEGVKYDYGYRGAPSHVALGFDSSKSVHRFAIEWGPSEIRWLVDDQPVHRRVNWDPTPIPQLPMTLHVNTWPSRSKGIRWRLNNQLLPATTVVRSISVDAALAANWRASTNGLQELAMLHSESRAEPNNSLELSRPQRAASSCVDLRSAQLTAVRPIRLLKMPIQSNCC